MGSRLDEVHRDTVASLEVLSNEILLIIAGHLAADIQARFEDREKQTPPDTHHDWAYSTEVQSGSSNLNVIVD
jgi:hypothetical protein